MVKPERGRRIAEVHVHERNNYVRIANQKFNPLRTAAIRVRQKCNGRKQITLTLLFLPYKLVTTAILFLVD